MTNFSNISESPVQFTRRNLFKSAAAGAATMATAGLSVAQAAPKKEGTYANNGAPEALRIRNDRISDENKKTLMALPCKYVPVAETIRGFREILDGKHDDLPESAFLFAGTIDEVVEKAKKGA